MTSLSIELRDVSKRFTSSSLDSPPSLDGLTLEVATGSVFGYLGTNGAGKTTTIRVLLGLVRPDGGHVRVLGMDPAVDAPRIRANVGVLLENDGLYDRLTAAQNLDFYARILHLDRDSRAARTRRIEEMLRSAGLWEKRAERVATFSKGMRQKLAFARTLLQRPQLVLLDEPFTGLDPIAASELRASIAELAREHGTTVLLTTHDLAHVEKVCDTIAVLRAGRVLARGTLDELRAQRTDVEVAVSGAGLDEDLLAAMKAEGAILSFALTASSPGSPGSPGSSGAPARARVVCRREHRVRLGVDLVQRGVVLEDLTTVRASLEDTFVALVGEAS